MRQAATTDSHDDNRHAKRLTRQKVPLSNLYLAAAALLFTTYACLLLAAFICLTRALT